MAGYMVEYKTRKLPSWGAKLPLVGKTSKALGCKITPDAQKK